MRNLLIILLGFSFLSSCGQNKIDMRLFSKKTNSIDWNTIKQSDKVYPKHSISLVTVQNQEGEISTGWIDKGYEKYPYMGYCPTCMLIRVDLTDSIAESNSDLDMGTVEDFFLENLQKFGVAHMIARIATESGMDIFMYVENKKQSETFLLELSASHERLVSFQIEMTDDPKWKIANNLMKI
jgi:hypothetical protein